MPYYRVGPNRVSCAVIVIAVGLSATTRASSTAATSEPVRNAIRQGLPRYDPKIREQQIALERSIAAHESERSASPSLNADEGKDIVALPRIIVRPHDQDKAPSAAKLPRVNARPPRNNVEIEEHLTPAAKDAQLVKKHLSSLDRDFLNRFTLPLFGRSRESRARTEEAVESTARQLNALAEVIEQDAALGADPAEQEKLRKLFLELYMARPK